MAIPEIIRLMKIVDKRIQDEKLDRKVKDDFKQISDAFEAKDEKALSDIFIS